MISLNEKDEMHSKVNKANNKETKSAVVYDYNPNMETTDLKYKMLQPYLLEQKRGPKWCMKLLKKVTPCSYL
jgi:hypothetical protein